MLFPSQGELVRLIDLLNRKYSDRYEIRMAVYNAAEYGVAQTRFRVVYRAWKKGLSWAEPHKKPMITLREAIGDLPSLEPGERSEIKNHYAAMHPANHVECMRHTPTGKSAFKNSVFYPKKADGSRIKGYGNFTQQGYVFLFCERFGCDIEELGSSCLDVFLHLCDAGLVE